MIIGKDNKSFKDFQYNKEFIDLMNTYTSNNNNYYDFRSRFVTKLKKNKHLTNNELITLTGLAGSIENKDLRLKVYETIIEELVLIVTGLEP